MGFSVASVAAREGGWGVSSGPSSPCWPRCRGLGVPGTLDMCPASPSGLRTQLPAQLPRPLVSCLALRRQPRTGSWSSWWLCPLLLGQSSPATGCLLSQGSILPLLRAPTASAFVV